jgi:hypothetical protein
MLNIERKMSEINEQQRVNEEIVKQSSLPNTSVNVDNFVSALIPFLQPPVGNRVWFQGTQFFAMVRTSPLALDCVSGDVQTIIIDLILCRCFSC